MPADIDEETLMVDGPKVLFVAGFGPAVRDAEAGVTITPWLR